MIAANEARKITEEAFEKLFGKRCEEIDARIRTAAVEGLDCIDLEGGLDYKIKKTIEELGYHVQSIKDDDVGRLFTRISWE